MRVAIYARVSTTDQDCEMQLRELRQLCAARAWAVAGEYVDTGWSGAKASRPELDRLMADARARRVDCILVWKLDRWGRSLINVLESIQELRSLGVRWIAPSQGIDTDEQSPTSRLLLTILAAVAEWERELIRERVKAGLLSARYHGRVGGRPKRVFSYDRAKRLRAEGYSIRAIAEKLKVGVGTIHRLLAAKG
jgi:putative DNA-invertase from lambdoid prophage Rac